MKEIAKVAGMKTYEYVFNYFSEQILSGELKMNDKIPPEREIAEKLGVSRNSVREVMHMLEISGLIECLQGSGNYIRCDTNEYMMRTANMVMALLDIDYTEIFYLRKGYESVALERAMEEALPEELEQMHKILLKMDETVGIKESADLDTQFHNILLQASHNRLLNLYASMLSNLMDQFIKDFRSRILVDKRRAEILRRSHWGIYNSLVEKDLKAGQEAVKRHFEVVEEQLKKY
ncbi:MAG: GntR family transcriptional regulator [Dorea sp.]|nr:GntR family transcriptional regulator [Dorea sp.]MDY2814209.1 GntR family transcriptional regulator [Dorea sp.]